MKDTSAFSLQTSASVVIPILISAVYYLTKSTVQELLRLFNETSVASSKVSESFVPKSTHHMGSVVEIDTSAAFYYEYLQFMVIVLALHFVVRIIINRVNLYRECCTSTKHLAHVHNFQPYESKTEVRKSELESRYYPSHKLNALFMNLLILVLQYTLVYIISSIIIPCMFLIQFNAPSTPYSQQEYLYADLNSGQIKNPLSPQDHSNLLNLSILYQDQAEAASTQIQLLKQKVSPKEHRMLDMSDPLDPIHVKALFKFNNTYWGSSTFSQYQDQIILAFTQGMLCFNTSDLSSPPTTRSFTNSRVAGTDKLRMNNGVGVSPDLKSIAMFYNHKYIELNNTSTGESLLNFQLFDENDDEKFYYVSRMTFSPDSTSIYFFGYRSVNRTLLFYLYRFNYPSATLEKLIDLPRNASQQPGVIKISPDGKLAYIEMNGASNGMIYFIRLGDSNSTEIIGSYMTNDYLDFSTLIKENTRMLILTVNKAAASLEVIDTTEISSPVLISTVEIEKNDPIILDTVLSPDETALIVPINLRHTIILDVSNLDNVLIHYSKESLTGELFFSPDGPSIYAIDEIKKTFQVSELSVVDTVDTVDTVGTVDTMNPVGTVDPVDPVGTVDTVNPVGTVNPVNPVNPVDPVDPLSFKAGTRIEIITLSQQTIRVEISLSNNPMIIPRNIPSCRFVRAIKTMIPVIFNSQNTTVRLEGPLQDVNQALDQLLIDLHGLSSCQGTISITDGQDPPLKEIPITDISSCFAHNSPPIIKSDMLLSLKEQLDKASISTGVYFSLNLDVQRFFKMNTQLHLEQTEQTKWLALNGFTLSGTPPEQLWPRTFDLQIIISNEYKSSSVPLTLTVHYGVYYLFKLVLKILCVFILCIYVSTIFNVLCKKMYRYPKDIMINVETDISIDQILPTACIAAELKESKYILKQLKKKIARDLECTSVSDKQLVTHFLNARTQQLDEHMLAATIEDVVAILPKSESSQVKYYTQESASRKKLIRQLIYNEISIRQIGLVEEKITKNVFMILKRDWIQLVTHKQEDPLWQLSVDEAKIRQELRVQGLNLNLQHSNSILELDSSTGQSESVSSQSKTSPQLPLISDSTPLKSNEKAVFSSLKGSLGYARDLGSQTGAYNKMQEDEAMYNSKKNMQVNFGLLCRALLSHAYGQQHLDVDSAKLTIIAKEKKEKLSWCPMFIAKLLKWDLEKIDFAFAGKLGYGIEYDLQHGIVRFHGSAIDEFAGRTMVVQMSRRGRILRELWLYGVDRRFKVSG